MSIFKENKTTSDRSANDRSSHKRKLNKALREGLKDLVSDESIITDANNNGKTKYKIPIRGIKEYRFVYGSNQGKQVGSAPGKDIKKGQKIGDSQQQGQTTGNKGSNEDGEEYYEVEVDLEEIAQMLFSDLNLPDLQKKQLGNVNTTRIKRNGYRPDGIMPRLDKKKSAIARIKRMKASGFDPSENVNPDTGEEESFPFHEEDLVYRHYKVKQEPCTDAVIFFIMDVSGSMTDDKRFLARSLFFLIFQFIRTKYSTVDIVFISHDTSAREVDEKQFFSQVTSGGTIASSAIELTNKIIKERYHPNSWNIYTFQSSDGDNYVDDNDKYYNQVVQLADKCQLFGYCEIDPGDIAGTYSTYESGLTGTLKPLQSETLKITKVTEKDHIWKAFKHMLGAAGE
jgi:sporulation protein YhbH